MVRQDRKLEETPGRKGRRRWLNHNLMKPGLLKLDELNLSSRTSLMESKIMVSAGFLGSRVCEVKASAPTSDQETPDGRHCFIPCWPTDPELRPEHERFCRAEASRQMSCCWSSRCDYRPTTLPGPRPSAPTASRRKKQSDTR